MSKMFELLRRVEKGPEGVADNVASENVAAERVGVKPPPVPTQAAREPEENGYSFARLPVVAVPALEPPSRPAGKKLLGVVFDIGLVLIGFVLFVGMCFVSGGTPVIARQNMPVLILGGILVGFFYWFLWELVDRDTPGACLAERGVVDLPDTYAEKWMPAPRQLPTQITRQVPPALPPPDPAKNSLIEELVLANRILAHKGVLETRGRVSVRDIQNPDRYFLTSSADASTVTASDVFIYDCDGKGAARDSVVGNSDRFIHGEIYKARPDVMAIVEWQAPAMIPFGVSTVPLLPVSHMAAFLGAGIPVFEMRGDAMNGQPGVRTMGRALAETLGDKPGVLLRGRGAMVVARSLHEAVGRAYYMTANARLQAQTILLGGTVTYLDAEETRNASPRDAFEQDWEVWKQKVRTASS